MLPDTPHWQSEPERAPATTCPEPWCHGRRPPVFVGPSIGAVPDVDQLGRGVIYRSPYSVGAIRDSDSASREGRH